MAWAAFDPQRCTATVRVGLVDGAECAIVPLLVKALNAEAPHLQVILRPVQFRTVEDLLLAKQADVAVCLADALPRSISRKRIGSGLLVCLYDSRFGKLPKKPSERDYFACEHVAVSYNEDARGVVEDVTGKMRQIRVSLPSFSYVADVLEGTALVAIVPAPLAHHLTKTRPHFKSARLPIPFEPAQLDLLWLRSTEDEPSEASCDCSSNESSALSKSESVEQRRDSIGAPLQTSPRSSAPEGRARRTSEIDAWALPR